jgi:hypothetical protein
MSTAGRVLEISDTALKIERTLRGKAETMVFILEKPFPGITVGDQLKVSYLEKEGRNILLRVAPATMTAVQKPKSSVKPATPPAGKTGPVTK